MRFSDKWPEIWNKKKISEIYYRLTNKQMPANTDIALQRLKKCINKKVKEFEPIKTPEGSSCLGTSFDKNSELCMKVCLDQPLCCEIYKKRKDLREMGLKLTKEEKKEIKKKKK